MGPDIGLRDATIPAHPPLAGGQDVFWVETLYTLPDVSCRSDMHIQYSMQPPHLRPVVNIVEGVLVDVQQKHECRVPRVVRVANP